jgi:hypothetical protein
MTNLQKISAIKSRIELLNARTGKENGKIVKKLERQIRALEKAAN